MTTALIYDPAYLNHQTGRHPENAGRIRRILAALEGDPELMESLVRVTPSAATDEDITRCHSPKLLESVRGLCERGERHVDMDTVICPESFEVAKLAAGAVIAGVDAVMTGQAANVFALVRPPGHHATTNRAMGFCLFNNVAIGARYAQARYGVENVAIVDWDVHHGNGTQDIFYADASVFYFSTHQYPYYPGTGARNETGIDKGEGFTLNIPLGEATSARSHREAFTLALDVIENKLPPDLILISAGFDAHRGDPLGGLMLEDKDFEEMTKEVMDLAYRRSHDRVISVLEGGYDIETLGQTVRTHIQALSS